MIIPALDAQLDQLADSQTPLLKPQDLRNRCPLGIAEHADGMIVSAYYNAKVIAVLGQVNQWDYDEAVKWFNFNIKGAYAGPGSPV